MNNPLAAIPPKVRLVGYFVYGVGSLVATYLAARGVLGADEISLWTGLGVLFGFTALSNMPSAEDVVEGQADLPPDAGRADVVLLVAVAALVIALLVLFGVRA